MSQAASLEFDPFARSFLQEESKLRRLRQPCVGSSASQILNRRDASNAGSRPQLAAQGLILIPAIRRETGDSAMDGRAEFLACDVTTEAGAKAMVAEASKAFGRAPDTLLHLVGGFALAAVEDDKAPQAWERMIAIISHRRFCVIGRCSPHCDLAAVDGSSA